MNNAQIILNSLQVAGIIILVIFIVGVILGLFDKAVYYYDVKDLIYTLIPLLCVIAFLFILVANANKNNLSLIGQSLFLTISGILLLVTGIFFFIVTIGNTFKSNNNHIFVSIVILISKFLFSGIISVISLLLLLGSSQGTADKEKRSSSIVQDIICLGILGFFGFIVKKLINGKTVIVLDDN